MVRPRHNHIYIKLHDWTVVQTGTAARLVLSIKEYNALPPDAVAARAELLTQMEGAISPLAKVGLMDLFTPLEWIGDGHNPGRAAFGRAYQKWLVDKTGPMPGAMPGETGNHPAVNAPSLVLGVNYEGGKCVEHAVSSPLCIAAYNCQISMDSPFEEGEAAPEHVRKQGRTESQMGVEDASLRAQLRPVLADAAAKATAAGASCRLVVQVARGRSAEPFWDAVVKPVLDDVGAERYALVRGYRTSDFPKFELDRVPFVYVNVGMFGRLTPSVRPGVVHAVEATHVIDDGSTPAAPRLASCVEHGGHDSALLLLPPCRLVSIPDSFPFVTPEHYKRESLAALAARAGGVARGLRVTDGGDGW